MVGGAEKALLNSISTRNDVVGQESDAARQGTAGPSQLENKINFELRFSRVATKVGHSSRYTSGLYVEYIGECGNEGTYSSRKKKSYNYLETNRPEPCLGQR